MRRTSLIRLAVAPVVGVVVLTGCGSTGDGPAAGGSSSSSAGAGSEASEVEPMSEEDLGERVYAAFREAGTLAFAVEQSGVASSRGTGVADLRGERPATRVTQEVQGIGKVEAVVLDGVFYVRAAQLGGEKWLEIDPEAKDGLGALVGSLGGNSDPSKLLEVMDRASEVTAEGTQDVDGVETTRYHVVLPREAFAATLGDDPRITRLLPEQVDLDLWVDAEDLVRKQVLDLTVAGRRTRSTIAYSEFGEPVDIEAPPASQTTTKIPALGGLGG